MNRKTLSFQWKLRHLRATVLTQSNIQLTGTKHRAIAKCQEYNIGYTESNTYIIYTCFGSGFVASSVLIFFSFIFCKVKTFSNPNKMGKVKKEKKSADETQEIGEVSIKEEDTYEDKLKHCSVIAQPMASKKLTKKCMKLIKKGQ